MAVNNAKSDTQGSVFEALTKLAFDLYIQLARGFTFVLPGLLA